MVFSSVIFLCIFLPVMIIGYYALPKKLRNIYLLLGSLFFYAWGEPIYIFIMLASIIGNYCMGLLIHSCAVKEKSLTQYILFKKLALILTIAYNLGVLIYFKYFTFILSSMKDLLRADFNVIQIALPIGISFYTFQGMSYVIDVYREDQKVMENGEICELVQKNPVNLALYISMFPQLIAGPIVRYTDIKNYLTERTLSLNSFAMGTERFIIGLAKKVIISNTLGEVSDKIFQFDFAMMGTATAWAGALLFTLQIYFDFSGYSDMAIGLGKIFGFKFMENFNYPYISKSITEFWRRWHISLSSWFRDYLYIPLGGNRRGNVYVNLLIVFLATGIWHGAEWSFLIWGLWHGCFILIERAFRNKEIRIPAFIKWLYTILIVVFGWVLFKIEDVVEALHYMGVMLHLEKPKYVAYSVWYYLDTRTIIIVIIAVLASIPWKEIMNKYKTPAVLASRIPESSFAILLVKRLVLIMLLLISWVLLVNNTYNPFLYFRF